MQEVLDFNGDGKVSLEEEVIGIQLVEGTLFLEDENPQRKRIRSGRRR